MRIKLPARRESRDEQWVKDKALSQYGVTSIKVGHSGWPDRWYLIPGGKPFIIEHKRETGTEAMPRQEWRMKCLKDIGYDVELIDDRHEALAAISHRVAAGRRAKAGR